MAQVPGDLVLFMSRGTYYAGSQETWYAIMDRYVNWHGKGIFID